MRDYNDLEALRELKDVWDNLQSLVKAGTETRSLSSDTLRRFRALVERGQRLYGRTSHLIDGPRRQSSGPPVDVQLILRQHDLQDTLGNPFWQLNWEGSHSAIVQAIGRQEQRIARLEQRGLTSEVVLRHRHLLLALERLRVAPRWPFSRVRFLLPLVTSIEQSPLYRLIAIVSVLAGAIGVVLVLVRC